MIENLLSRHDIEAVRRPLGTASLLPPITYSSESIFNLEKTRIFARTWMAVCHVSQLPQIGSYVTKDLAGEPVVAVRNRAGEVQVLSNVCRHRNMKLLQGAGKCPGNRITCPYHSWSYGLDGTLGAAPQMDKLEGFNKADYGLWTIRHEVWHGFVFANLDDKAPGLREQLAGMESYVAPYRFEDMVALELLRREVDWNWKLSMENFSEAYHQPCVHTHTAEKFAEGFSANYFDNDNGPWSAFHIPNIGNKVGPTLVPAWNDMPDHYYRGAMVFNVYPYFHMITDAASPLWLDFNIKDNGHHELVWHMLFPKTSVNDDNRDQLLSQSRDIFLPVIEEDVSICRGVGAGSHSRLARAGRLCHMEKVLHQFHNWWLDQVGAA